MRKKLKQKKDKKKIKKTAQHFTVDLHSQTLSRFSLLLMVGKKGEYN